MEQRERISHILGARPSPLMNSRELKREVKASHKVKQKGKSESRTERQVRK